MGLRTCKHCGRELVRKNYKYRWETVKDFRKRIYCDMECYRLYANAHRKYPPPSGLTAAEVQAGRDQRHKDRQNRPHTGFHLSLIQEWLREWR